MKTPVLAAALAALAIQALAADPGWIPITREGTEPVLIRQAGVVRFGADGDYLYRSFQVGTYLQCTGATFGGAAPAPEVAAQQVPPGEPVPSKWCESKEAGLLLTPLGSKVPAPDCLPWGSPSTTTAMILEPAGEAAWLKAGPEANFIVAAYCAGTVSTFYGFKRDLPPDPERWARSYLQASVTQKRSMIDARQQCKPGMNANVPPCVQYRLLAARAQELAETPPPGR